MISGSICPLKQITTGCETIISIMILSTHRADLTKNIEHISLRL